MIDVGLVSYAIAAVSYGLLSILLLWQWNSRVGPAVLIACAGSTAWATTIALGTLADYPPILLMQLTEMVRDAGWILLLLQMISLQSSGDKWVYGTRQWKTPAAIALGLACANVLIEPALEQLDMTAPDYLRDLSISIWLLIAVFGLLLVEQLYRNASPTERWSTKFICLAIGGMFAYDFFMYAEALLFRQLDSELWRARGLVMVVALPWMVVGIVRQRQTQIDLQISRQVVFHSVTLMAAGLYLLCVSMIGYYIRYRGGDWGGVLQLGFLASGFALLLSLLFSGRLRANLRVLLNKHFFSYSYDYREEWLKFTAALAGLSEDVPVGIIQTMAPLVDSNAGLLFAREQDRFDCIAHWQMPMPNPDEELGSLAHWMQNNGWVIDLREWRQDPSSYREIEIPQWLRQREDIWLLVPLIFREKAIGVLLLRRAELKEGLNWEDRDLLKTAGRQAATQLAQHLSSRALLEARQFDAFNRLSAYVVHDLKNILAQQSLMIANADRHKSNPAFVDDMIATVANSVGRMQRLMDQMRSGIRDNETSTVTITGLLSEVARERSLQDPVPELRCSSCACRIHADRERIATVFAHLVQNAQEATANDGEVIIEHDCDEQWARVSIRDNGVGMSEAFLRERLFKPFDSTKGLTGMGIGAFESREYVRQIGGDIVVQSTEGAGSNFTVSLPTIDSREDFQSIEATLSGEESA